jgi:hypothetical protein
MVPLVLIALITAAGGPSGEVPRYISANGSNVTFSVKHREAQVLEEMCSSDTCQSRPGNCEDETYLCVWIGGAELAVPRDIWTKLPRTFLENGLEQTWTHGRYRYDPSPPLFGAQVIMQGTPFVGPIRFLGKEVQGILVKVIAADNPKFPVLASFVYAKDFGVVAFATSSPGGSGESFWLEDGHGILAQ